MLFVVGGGGETLQVSRQRARALLYSPVTAPARPPLRASRTTSFVCREALEGQAAAAKTEA